MGRAPCCDKPNVKRGPWSPEEDSKLKAYIEKHGTGGNWIALPHKVGLKRCGKSCRLRWLNYLRPNLKHGGFSEEEENVICSFYICIGSRWSIIAAQLPGRTDNDIKNYWNTKLKKKLFAKFNVQQNLRLTKQAEMEKVKGHVHLEADTSTEIHGTQLLQQHNNITMNMNGSYGHLGSGNIVSELFECTTHNTPGSTIPSSKPDGFHELNLQQALFYQETPFLDHYSYPMKPIAVRLGSPSSDTMNVMSQFPQPTVETSAQISYGTAPISIWMENLSKEESASLHHIDNSAVLSSSSSIGGGSVDEDSDSSLMHAFNAQNKKILSNEGCELSMDFNDLLYSSRDNYSSLVPFDSCGWLGETN